MERRDGGGALDRWGGLAIMIMTVVCNSNSAMYVGVQYDVYSYVGVSILRSQDPERYRGPAEMPELLSSVPRNAGSTY